MSQKFYSFDSNQPALVTITRQIDGSIETVLKAGRIMTMPQELIDDLIERTTEICDEISDKPGSVISIY